MNKNLLVKNLTSIIKLLSTKERWTQGWYAKNKNGNNVGVISKNAVCFCLIGAACRFREDDGEDETIGYLRNNLDQVWGNNLVGFNDSSTYEEVVSFLNRCLENAKNLPENLTPKN